MAAMVGGVFVEFWGENLWNAELNMWWETVYVDCWNNWILNIIVFYIHEIFEFVPEWHVSAFIIIA